MKLIVLVTLLLAVSRLQAQVADRATISSGGDFVLLANLNFQSTVGETIIATIQSGGVMLTQGFQQPEQVINIPIGNDGIPSNVVIYPNPAVEQVKIRFNLDAPAWIQFSLINNAGQMMYRSMQSFSLGTHEVPFDFKVAAGLYFLTLSYDGKTTTTKVIIE